MTRPRIGITTSYEDGEQRLDRRYLLAVERAGGQPVIIPMCESEDVLADILSAIDGVVIPGGPAIVDGLIGSLPKDLPPTDPVRTRSDKMILSAVEASNRPVLGICYGMQLINAHAGGTIYGDVQAMQETSLSHSEKRGGRPHGLTFDAGSMVSRLLAPNVEVNTRHIQAVAAVGRNYKATAHAPDGVIEAIESENGLVLGVQFHPERMGPAGAPLFENLVRLAARHRESFS